MRQNEHGLRGKESGLNLGQILDLKQTSDNDFIEN